MDDALERFAGIVGAEAVLRSSVELRDYLDPYALDDPDKFAPAAAVLPSRVEHVQQLLRVARELSIPLWTISRGKNLGYGGAAPRVRGSVILDLRRMNRILELDEELAYALVEPGVSYFDLYDHIRDHDLRLWPSVPALGWGSIVGNTLERGWGYTSHGDHAQQLCGLEVVLADGSMVRTGMGAITGSRTWNLLRGGFGPGLESLFLQSNFGVVTKLGTWLMPRPQAYATCHLDVAREADLAALVDVLAALRRRDELQSNPVIGNPVRYAAMAGSRSRWFDGPGAMPNEVLEEIRAELGIGWWRASFGLYGSERLVDARVGSVREAVAGLSGAKLDVRKYVGAGPDGLRAEEIPPPDRAAAAGVPGLTALSTLGFRGGVGGQLTFSPILPCRGREALDFYRLTKQLSANFGFDFFGGIHVAGRHLAHVTMIVFDTTDDRQRQDAHDLFMSLSAAAAERGYGEYRAHVAFMDLVAAQYDWGDHALMRVSERLKDALDPAGVLSPGKQGIWPGGQPPRYGPVS